MAYAEDTQGHDCQGEGQIPARRAVQPELTPAKTQQAAWAEHDRTQYFWEQYRMMAALDRRLPKRSYESMLPENRVPVTQ